MAEIRIPYDRIPADIWRRLRDISNEVINPFTTLENTTSTSSFTAASTSSSSSSSLLSSSSTPTTTSVINSPLAETLAISQDMSFSTREIPQCHFSIPSCSPSNRNSEFSSRSRLSKPTIKLSQVHDQRTYNNQNDVISAGCDVDEVDGGDVDSSIVHVVDDAAIRHRNSSRVSGLEVMDESDIVRIFPDADVGMSKGHDERVSNHGRFASEDSGIVRIFPNDDKSDDEHRDNDDGVDNDCDDVVDHMSSGQTSHFEEPSGMSVSTFKISPAKYPKFVQHSKPEIQTSLTVPFHSIPRDQDLPELQSFVRYEQDDRIPRKTVPMSRYSHYKEGRRKILPGKSANTNHYPSVPSSSTQSLYGQHQQLQTQVLSLDKNQFCDVQNAKYGNTNPSLLASMANSLKSTPLKYANATETTPTKVLRKSPSNFGKIRRSPGLLPTPPQTPDEVDVEDDDEVFSYDVLNRSCTNLNLLSNGPALLRRNSDSRANEPEKLVRRPTTHSSPFPFSPTNKMAKMKVGDRQHTRKRLSFEGVESNTPCTSINEYEQPNPHFWPSQNTSGRQQQDIVQCVSSAVLAQKMSNNPPPPHGKSISPFNLPTQSHLQTSGYLSTSPNAMSSSSCNNDFDIDRQAIHPSQNVQVCCSGSTSCQSPPRLSQRQMALPTNVQSSLNITTTSEQTLPFLTSVHHNVETEGEELVELHQMRYSPIQKRIYRAEGHSRLRFNSEGFSEDILEQFDDTARPSSSHDDDIFKPRPRVQTMSSYGKRRRLEIDEEVEDEDEINLSRAQTPTKSTPQKLSPSPNNKTSPNSRPTISPQLQAMTSQMWSNIHNNNINSSSNDNNNLQQAVSSSPHENCSCATLLRNFLSVTPRAFKDIPNDSAKFRQELLRTNSVIRDTLSLIQVITGVCEHHKVVPPSTPHPTGESNLISSESTEAEAISQQPSGNAYMAQSLTLLRSFQMEQNPDESQ